MYVDTRTTYPLLLELSVLRDEQGKTVIDATLRQKLLEFLLNGDIEGVKLKGGSK